MELLSTEEKATMLMNLFRFQENEEPILDTPMLKMCWASMKFLLEKDAVEYNNKVDRGRNAGQSNNKVPYGTVTVQYDTVQNNIDNVNDNVNDNVDVNEDGDGSDWMTMFRQGETPKSLFPKYPDKITEITSSWVEYIK